MPPKRKITEEQREARRVYQAKFRREHRDVPGWKESESLRTAVRQCIIISYKIFYVTFHNLCNYIVRKTPCIYANNSISFTQRYQKKVANMTPEELEEFRAKTREKVRKHRAAKKKGISIMWHLS